MIRFVLLLALGLGFANAAFADPVQIRSDLLKETVVETADGAQRVQAPMDRATPGDTIIIRLTYLNDGATPATNVVISNPLPQQLAYVEAREGAAPDVSVDGGRTFAQLAKLIVAAEGQDRPARADDVTHVRWTIASAIAPGESGTVAFATRLK